MPITDVSIRALDAPEEGTKIIYDDALPGFGVRVSSNESVHDHVAIDDHRKAGIILVAEEAPIAIGSGPSKALAKELIRAPADVLIKVTLDTSRLKLHFVSGSAYVAGAKIGTLTNIVYTLIPKTQLIGCPTKSKPRCSRRYETSTNSALTMIPTASMTSGASRCSETSFFWKIEYFDERMKRGSEDPSDLL